MRSCDATTRCSSASLRPTRPCATRRPARPKSKETSTYFIHRGVDAAAGLHPKRWKTRWKKKSPKKASGAVAHPVRTGVDLYPSRRRSTARAGPGDRVGTAAGQAARSGQPGPGGRGGGGGGAPDRTHRTTAVQVSAALGRTGTAGDGAGTDGPGESVRKSSPRGRCRIVNRGTRVGRQRRARDFGPWQGPSNAYFEGPFAIVAQLRPRAHRTRPRAAHHRRPQAASESSLSTDFFHSSVNNTADNHASRGISPVGKKWIKKCPSSACGARETGVDQCHRLDGPRPRDRRRDGGSEPEQPMDRITTA